MVARIGWKVVPARERAGACDRVAPADLLARAWVRAAAGTDKHLDERRAAAVLVAEGHVAAHGSAPVTPETPPTTKPPEAAEEPARLWPKVAIAAALMLLIAAIGTVYSTQRDDRDATTVSAPKKHSAPVTTTTERTTATTGPTTTTTTTTTTTLPPPPPTEAPTVAAPVPLAAPAPAATYYANCEAVRAGRGADLSRSTRLRTAPRPRRRRRRLRIGPSARDARRQHLLRRFRAETARKRLRCNVRSSKRSCRTHSIALKFPGWPVESHPTTVSRVSERSETR